jgi:hypothetical protein
VGHIAGLDIFNQDKPIANTPEGTFTTGDITYVITLLAALLALYEFALKKNVG